MKIIFCLHHFLPEFVAGTEIYTLRLAQSLKQEGCEVLVLIPHFDRLKDIEYEYEGIRVIGYSEISKNNREMISGNYKPLGLERFKQLLQIEKPNIVHFHELSAGRGINIFHVEVAHNLKISILLTCHLPTYTCFTGSLVYKDLQKCEGILNLKKCTECIYDSKNITGAKSKILVRSALLLYDMNINCTKLNNSVGTALSFPYIINKKIDDLLKLGKLTSKIIVLTEWYKNILIKNGIGSDKIVYIKQGITNETNSCLPKNPISLPLKIVFLGRISKLKGLDLIIDAVCKLPIEKITLHIYGQETVNEYATLCKQKSEFNKNIHWMGLLPSIDVVKTLSNYDMLCLPSIFSEMSPLVIQEAFAAGIPVLASDVYGNAEQITDGVNGWLFRFKDTIHLVEKLESLINDLTLVDKAKQKLPKSDSFKDIARKHIELYDKIINVK